MMLKFQQIFLLALPTCNILARHAFSPTASSVLAALFALFCSGRFLYLTLKSTPYVDPVNDRMEIISKACLIITPTVVLILAIAPSVGANNTFGVILNIVAVVGNIGMVIALLYPLPAVQSFFKKLSGRLDFTSTDGITDHQDEKALPDWDLDVERMRRIWKPFWDKILFESPEMSGESIKTDQKPHPQMAPDNSGIPIPYPGERLTAMVEKLHRIGFDAFEAGIRGVILARIFPPHPFPDNV